MYLKTLTMRGFKSFAKATSLELEPGITCVVGPNGSGKSNVVDALAWVMGEQGAKNLRGGKMDDVIFAGTAGRQGLGRAEVSLTIDNTDGAIPIDYTEVTISRTLFKSGGSEYAVNGATARLIDIQELLNDSGLGKEMHVIVGQGRLDEILHADPMTRRGFIEEAAGVLKHRRRKDKALRKLTGLQTNLDRLGDLRGELSRQLGPLARQAKAASRAAVVQAQLRDATARLLADDIVRLQAKIETTHDDTLTQRTTELTTEVETLDATIAGITQRFGKRDTAIEQSESNLTRLAAIIAHAHGLAARARDRNEFLQAETTSAPVGEDPQALETRAAHYRKERDQAADLLTARQADLDAATATRTELATRRDTATQELARERERIRAHLRERASLETAATVAERAVDDAQRELDTLASQAPEARATLDAAAAKLTRAQELAAQVEAAETDLDATHERATTAATQARTHLAHIRERLTTARNTLDQTCARIDALTLAATFEASDITQLGLDGVRGPLAELLTITPGHERPVTAVLGPLATAVAVDSPQAAATVLSEVSGDVDVVVTNAEVVASAAVPPPAAGPAGVVRVRSVVSSPSPAINDLLDAALAGVFEAADVTQAQEWVEKYPQCVFVTPEGEVFSAHRVRRSGGAESARFQAKAALEDAQASRAEQEKAVKNLEAEEAQAQEALSLASEKETRALEALYASDAQILGAGAQVSEAASALEKLREEARVRQTRMDELTHHIEQARAKAQAAQEQLSTNTSTIDEEPDTSEVDEISERHREVSEKVMELTIAVRSARDRVTFLGDRAAALMRQAEQVRAAREEAARVQARRAAMAGVARDIGEAADLLARHFTRLQAQVTEELAAHKDARSGLRGELAQAQQARNEASEELTKLGEAQHAATVARERYLVQFEELERRATTEVGLSVENLVEQFGPHQPVPTEDGEPVAYVRAEQEKIATRAKKEIASIGAVNPLALEEYQALKERHDYLETQITDIEATRKDLLTLVDDVDAHVRDVFAGAFADTQREFAQVFERLFPGGQGELALTEPDDLLNTGVEVFARPAGKRVQRLSLLSGGERSLVAVAILVAIFKARPSPFYVMDEVEAALDDANLSRLLTVFKELQESSQLIVITHQKRTMEIADALYGVTMGGDGISKVISQKLT